MNNGRFLLLINSKEQEHYYTLTSEIIHYAVYKAKGLDNADGVACGALAKLEDLMIEGHKCNSWWHVRSIIDNFIISERRKRTAANTFVKNGYPRDHIIYIKNPLERRSCCLYWINGLKQREVVTQMGKTKQYVSKIIKKHKKVDNRVSEYGYPQFIKKFSPGCYSYSKTLNYYDHFPLELS